MYISSSSCSHSCVNIGVVMAVMGGLAEGVIMEIFVLCLLVFQISLRPFLWWFLWVVTTVVKEML